MKKKQVAVIGAGIAGLVTIKSCLEEGIEVTAFEKSDYIGGNWKFKEQEVSVFRNTELSSSRYITGFSDFPIPEHYPHFLKHEQYLEYLLDYARHFKLKEHIKFGITVDSLKRQGEKWLLVATKDGISQEYEFDAVAVCTGLNEEPNLPKFPNIEQFKGQLVHSSLYKDNTPYKDKSVVVIGGGESGGDQVNEISQVAKSVTLSLRRGVFIMPKLDKCMTLPGDYFHHRGTYHYPPVLYERIETAIQRLFTFANRKQKSWQIRQKLIKLSGGSYHQQFITKSDTFMQALAKPNVALKPQLERFEPDGVVFSDGSKVQADAVVFSSGFNVHFPFLPIDSKNWDWRKLYKKMFHPELNNLGFVGFARPNIGSMPPIMEMQSRYFAGVVSGRLQLPEPAKMEKIIEQDAQDSRKLKPLVSDRITGIVSYVPYMYELSELIGCRPVLRQLISRPVVLWSVLFSSVAAPHFRICGPHANPAMLDEIERQGLHIWKLKTLDEKLLFVMFQVVWGLGGLVGYPLFKTLSSVPGFKELKPSLDF
ncbi:MAG: NAD(P)-binding domain-containing protein [Pleurocapsa sp. MO_226.B13]|nr:NAD(P)-binding domain-containing protein [Pleurocapsa sp. MO_226.B13]